MEARTMRILLGIDGSVPADVAVELAANLAWPMGSEIVVAEAVASGAALFGGPWPVRPMIEPDRLEAEGRAAAERHIAEACRRLARPGLTVTTVVLRGRPSTEIVDQAQRMSADLIVVGSRGHGTIESMLLGSVSAEVVDHAATPVLIARRLRIARVVLAWDGSPCAMHAAALVRIWPIFEGCSVRVVSVADVDPPWATGPPAPMAPDASGMLLEAADAIRSRHVTLAHEMAADLRAAGVAAQADRREGDPAAQILAAAASSRADADLIVLGTRGRTGLTRLALGSVARNVLQHAACSILIVNDGTSESRAPDSAQDGVRHLPEDPAIAGDLSSATSTRGIWTDRGRADGKPIDRAGDLARWSLRRWRRRSDDRVPSTDEPDEGAVEGASTAETDP